MALMAYHKNGIKYRDETICAIFWKSSISPSKLWQHLLTLETVSNIAMKLSAIFWKSSISPRKLWHTSCSSWAWSKGFWMKQAVLWIMYLQYTHYDSRPLWPSSSGQGALAVEPEAWIRTVFTARTPSLAYKSVLLLMWQAVSILPQH
jgi:hypothetical protein